MMAVKTASVQGDHMSECVLTGPAVLSALQGYLTARNHRLSALRNDV